MTNSRKLSIKYAHPVDDLKTLGSLTGPVGDDFIVSLNTLYQSKIRRRLSVNTSLPIPLIEMIVEYALLSAEFFDSIFSSGSLNDIQMLISTYPQLVNYRNSTCQTPLDLAFNKKVLDPKTIKYLVMKEAKFSDFWKYYSGIRNEVCDPSVKEGLEYYVNAPSLLTLAFLEKLFGPCSDIISAYLYGDEGKCDAGIKLSTQLVSLIQKILHQSDWEEKFLEKRKAYFELAKNLLDRGAHILAQGIDSSEEQGKYVIYNYHTIFSSFFHRGIPNSYGLSDSEFCLYEKLYQSSSDYYTRFFLTLLIYDNTDVRFDHRTRPIVSKLFNVYINANADIDLIFFFAIKYHYLEILDNLKDRGLLEEFKVNQKDCNKQTALYLATVSNAPVKILRELLEMKADVNHQYQVEPTCRAIGDPKKIEVSEKMEGYRMLMMTSLETFYLEDSALHTAIREYSSSKNIPTISTLLDFNADANLKTRAGETPLHLALNAIDRDSYDPYLPVISLLLEAKADMNIPYQGQSSLYRAVREGHQPLIHLFFKYGNELLFSKFLEFYSPGILNNLLSVGLSGQLSRSGKDKITTMHGVMGFFSQKVKNGKTPTHTAYALQQLEQHILREGEVKLDRTRR